MRLPAGTRRLVRPDQVELLASPLRLELLEHVRLAGTASVTDLARLSGRPATTLHHHVKLLWRAGLLKVEARRPAGRRGEALYALAAERFAVGPGGAISRQATVRTLGATLRLAQREAARSLSSGRARGSGPGRNLHLRRLRAPLGAAARAELNRLLDAVERLFEREVRRRSRRGRRVDASGGEVLALTLVLAGAGSRGSEEG